jgi:EAL domain-containing protein (putative c-di-GMP-specific phosphodiesterase class I)
VRSDRSRFIALVVVNGAMCVVAPVALLFHPDRTEPFGGHSHAFVAALLVVALAPLQLTALWFVLRGSWHDIAGQHRIDARLARVIDEGLLTTTFQPIVSVHSRHVAGVEALARFTSDATTSPDVWFAQAELVGRGVELELLAIRTHLAAARALPDHLYVAVNASPAAVLNPDLLHALLAGDICPTRIVVEITEHATVADYAPLQNAVDTLRVHGVRLAVDDAGSGYASFRHIVALAPDIIKIDRALISGIDQDKACRAMVASLVLYALDCGSLVVGEGVETAAELESLELLGVDAVQGYHLGRPTSDPGDYASWKAPPASLLPARQRWVIPEAV